MQNEEKSYIQIKKEMYEKYRKEIVPKLRRFRNAEKDNIQLANTISNILSFLEIAPFLFFVIIMFVFIVLFAKDLLSQFSIALFGGFFALFGKFFGLLFFAIIIQKNIKFIFYNYSNKRIKEKIMPIVCTAFDNIKWEKYEPDKSLFFESLIVPHSGNVYYDDMFKGSYKGVNIEIIEPEFVKGTSRSSEAVFDGVIIKLDMNKNFNGHTLIRENTGFKHTSPSKKLKYTELEDNAFNKKFDVFTDDEIEARYLITPSFMNRIKKVELAFQIDKINCAFYKNFLILALATNKDLFSLNLLFEKKDNAKEYFKLCDEVISIIRLIDYFKINQKTGL